MREILFRGKSINKNKWIEGFLFPQNIDCGYCSLCICSSPISANDYSEILGSWSIVSEDTIGQYTGLTDKNGKKIFEGDIIKIFPNCACLDDYDISKVYSYNGVFCVDYHGDDFDSTALGFLENYIPDGAFEVLGNIYDNPELLEVEK